MWNIRRGRSADTDFCIHKVTQITRRAVNSETAAIDHDICMGKIRWYIACISDVVRLSCPIYILDHLFGSFFLIADDLTSGVTVATKQGTASADYLAQNCPDATVTVWITMRFREFAAGYHILLNMILALCQEAVAEKSSDLNRYEGQMFRVDTALFLCRRNKTLEAALDNY